MSRCVLSKAARELLLAVWPCALALLPGTAGGDAASTPLVVVIAVDQLRNDRLTADLPGGLGRIVRLGYRFENSSLAHGLSNTCPGHAALSTGMHPGKAGVPGNEYVDRAGWRERYCVEDNDAAHRVIGGSRNRSPELLKVTALGDWLRSSVPGARVFSVGGKDRSAIMMGGRHPNGVFWFDPDQMRFTSSGYYAGALPAYVDAFNSGWEARLPARWEHPPGTYRPDDFQGESKDHGNVSGHALMHGAESGRQIVQSPFLDELTLDLAEQIIDAENLGSSGVTDLLMISLSAVDTVGHLYGPYSAESEDTLNRLDRGVAEFLDYLDGRFGAGGYLVALSADHGITDLPEWSLANGSNRCPVPGSRLSYLRLLAGVFARIYWRHTFPFDSPSALVRLADGQVYINANYVRDQNLDMEAVRVSIAQILADTPGVEKVWSLPEIEQGADDAARLLRNSLVPGLSGDLFLQLHPDCMIGDTGTTHGSLHLPDRSVPLVFFGAGIELGSDAMPAYSVDLSPTLAKLLGIEMPDGLDGRALSVAPVPDPQ